MQAGWAGKGSDDLKIYVGNLPFSATERDVTELFATCGDVQSVALPTDRETGRPRGFGFVEIGTVTPRPQAGNPPPRARPHTAGTYQVLMVYSLPAIVPTLPVPFW